ncbi:MAG: NAD(P)-binding protein [Gammaproteobacteria bacterium]|nr:NAD(P)-binding protein [Gammaproteobacteria bacterium]
MKIAIIGSGVAGLTAAHLLHQQHDIAVYESSNHIGGHVNTIDLYAEEIPVSIDTGFIVFNNWTYPSFEKLIGELNIQIQDSEMSFSAKCEATGFEWSGSGLQSLIFNNDNWKQLKPYQIFYDIVRFKKLALAFLDQTDKKQSLGDFLNSNKFSTAFIKYYILPMGAAIWSSTLVQINDYPARSFLTFFKNHGLLNLKVRPQWKTIAGGSKQYVSELIKPFKNKIHTNTAVKNVKRVAARVEIFSEGRAPEYFDHVIFACHSDQVLSLLDHSSSNEIKVLGNIQYQKNIAVLHTDESTMPVRKSAWSSWNYLVPVEDTGNANVTYYMNRLQNLKCKQDYFVTLNPYQEINASKIIKTIDYMHPVFDQHAIEAQQQHDSISGQNNTWYCGAYWRNGFHEDGVWSAIRAVEQFNRFINDEKLYLQRAS